MMQLQDQRSHMQVQQFQQAAQIQQAIRLLEMQREKLATAVGTEGAMPDVAAHEPPRTLQRVENVYPEFSHQGSFPSAPAMHLTASLSSIFGSGDLQMQNFNSSPADARGSFVDGLFSSSTAPFNVQKDPLAGILHQPHDSSKDVTGHNFQFNSEGMQPNCLPQAQNGWQVQNLVKESWNYGGFLGSAPSNTDAEFGGSRGMLQQAINPPKENLQSQHSFSQQLDLPRNYSIVTQPQMLFPSNDICQTGCATAQSGWQGQNMVADLSICGDHNVHNYFSQSNAHARFQAQSQRSEVMAGPGCPSLSEGAKAGALSVFSTNSVGRFGHSAAGPSAAASSGGPTLYQGIHQHAPASHARSSEGLAPHHAPPHRPMEYTAGGFAGSASGPAGRSQGSTAAPAAQKADSIRVGPGAPSQSGKLVLTSEAACAIYALRPRAGERKVGKSHSQSNQIAAMHGVTAKTIRDIWNRSTWAKATRHLWTEEELAHYVEQRKRMSAKLDPSHGLPTWCTDAAPTSPLN